MTYQERFAEGPEDQPAIRPACPDCRSSAEAYFVGVHRGREMFRCLKCGKYYAQDGEPVPPRVVCSGWEGIHTDTRVLSEGSEPVSRGMCADCERAVARAAR